MFHAVVLDGAVWVGGFGVACSRYGFAAFPLMRTERRTMGEGEGFCTFDDGDGEKG